MFNWIRQHKISSAIAFLLIGLTIGLGIAVKSNIFSKTNASIETSEGVVAEEPAREPAKEYEKYEPAITDLQNSFIKVAEVVGPAVVSIVTETTQRIPARRYYFGPPKGFFDEDFERFFKDFFGEIPEREFKRQGLGSGVIIDKAGHIVTNDHVIADAGKITVILSDGRKFDAEVKGSDLRSDIAVIKIKAGDLPMVKLGDSDSVKTGQWVVAIGNPFGFVVNNPKPTLTVGVVSALHRSLPLGTTQGRSYIDLIQTDAAINPGNSGGPLCDLEGNVIGLNAAIYSTTGGYQGIGFAIPVNTVKRVLDDLIEGREVLYGWLGVTVQELTYDMAEYFNIEDRKGVIVIEVIKDGPADRGGIKAGDIIRTFDEEEVDTLQSLLKYVGEAKVGKKVKAGIIRDGKEMALTVIVGERPSEETLAKGKVTEEGALAETWRGLAVSEITDEIAQRYNVEKQPGVLIVDVDIDSTAYDAGLRSGMIIKSINKSVIQNMKDYDEVIKNIKSEDKVLIKTDSGYFIVK